MIKWDVRSISSEFVLWMCDDHAQAGATSLVGILSSSAFESMISKFVDRSLSENLRLLVKLTSFHYSCGSQMSYAECDSTSLWSLRCFAGTRVLQGLELALGNASLAVASREKLTALFLVQFATIIAVGYSDPRIPSRDLGASTPGLPDYQLPMSAGSCTSSPSKQVFSETRAHLLRILVHHMVYIAERVGLLGPKVSKKRIIESSACRWNRRAMFPWKVMPAPKDADVQSNLVSSCNVQGNSRRADGYSPTGYPAHYYHLSRSHPVRSTCRPAGGFGSCVHEESLNIEPSPMDHILARYKQMTSALRDVQTQLERPSTPLLDLQSINHAPHSTPRCSSDYLPSLSARDGNYAAFECLAEADGMCPPFLCTDDDEDGEEDENDDNNTDDEASSTDGTSALIPSPSSTLRNSSSSSRQDLMAETTNDANSNPDQRSACRSCKLKALPFDTLGQDQLCEFCSAWPLDDDGDDMEAFSSSNVELPHPDPGPDPDQDPNQELPAHGPLLDGLMQELGSGNLLV